MLGWRCCITSCVVCLQKRVKVVVLAVAVVWGLAGLLLVVPSILFLVCTSLKSVACC
jgi:hypothetical protein